MNPKLCLTRREGPALKGIYLTEKYYEYKEYPSFLLFNVIKIKE